MEILPPLAATAPCIRTLMARQIRRPPAPGTPGRGICRSATDLGAAIGYRAFGIAQPSPPHCMAATPTHRVGWRETPGLVSTGPLCAVRSCAVPTGRAGGSAYRIPVQEARCPMGLPVSFRSGRQRLFRTFLSCCPRFRCDSGLPQRIGAGQGWHPWGSGRRSRVSS